MNNMQLFLSQSQMLYMKGRCNHHGVPPLVTELPAEIFAVTVIYCYYSDISVPRY